MYRSTSFVKVVQCLVIILYALAEEIWKYLFCSYHEKKSDFSLFCYNENIFMALKVRARQVKQITKLNAWDEKFSHLRVEWWVQILCIIMLLHHVENVCKGTLPCQKSRILWMMIGVMSYMTHIIVHYFYYHTVDISAYFGPKVNTFTLLT